MSLGREPRLLVYSQDGLGLGHQRRTTLLATEFLRACPGASVLTVSDSPLGKFFASTPGHDYCKLPSVHKAGPGDWQPVSLHAPFGDVLRMRSAILREAALAFAPDVLLVDHMPHGAMGELVPTLEALKDEPTTVVLGLRDILDAPEVVRDRWHAEGAYEAVERYYDKVLVFGSADVFDQAAEYHWPEAARQKIEYCGYVCAPPPPDVSRRLRARYLRRAPGSRLVLAVAGGGADARPMFDAVLDALPFAQRASPTHLVLITGPFLPAPQRRALAARAQGMPVSVLTSVSDPVSYLAAADVVVSMAGYNTTAEILSVGARAVLLPRPGPSAEQQMRARLFAERGWVSWLPPNETNGATVGAAVNAGLGDGWAGPPSSRPDLGGRSVGAGRLVEALSRDASRAPSLRSGLPPPRRGPRCIDVTDEGLAARGEARTA